MAEATGGCSLHVERAGLPCSRCGTFACSECLLGGLCVNCRAGGRWVPQAEDTVGFGPRAGARVIDSLARMGLAFASMVVSAFFLALLTAAHLVRPGWEQRLGQHVGANFLIGLVSALLGVAAVTLFSGASLGKLIFGLRVRSLDGSPVTARGALLREVGYLFDGLFFGLVGKSEMESTPLNQRHGDKLGGTIVVKSRPELGQSLPLVLLGVAAGLALEGSFMALGYFLAAR